jgi:hypothetical protein
MHLFDAALGVAAVGAHVPLANGAVWARRRVRSAHNAHHMLAHRQVGGSRVEHPAQGLVAEDQLLLTGWGPPVAATRDLGIGAADADCQRFDDDGSEFGGGLGDIVELG